jgi:catechol-2,3-dioxygenase
MSTKFAVITLWAENVEEQAHFYRDILGLQPLPHHGGSPHFSVDGIYLVMFKGLPRSAEYPETPDFPVFALSVDDLDQAIEKLKLHEVVLPWGIESNKASRWVKFHDPGGNLIELVQFN